VSPNGGRVSIEVGLHSGETKVDILDNGCGMDRAFVRGRLFTPFETTKGSGGMGIGVYEAREYIRALGGDIQVASKPKRGTTFTIAIPLAVRETGHITEQRRACS
jgi:signal transduction histidine kinase